jgi:predicted nucleic acid-binding protein
MSVLPKHKIVVQDACILFDLIDLELLEVFFRLDLIVLTTPEVIVEVEDEQQLNEIKACISQNKIQVSEAGNLMDLVTITTTNPGLSLADASVIILATKKNATILSSDKSLRNEAKRRGLGVNGILWVVEELFNREIIMKEALAHVLAIYPEKNKRAPLKEIERLKEKLIIKDG